MDGFHERAKEGEQFGMAGALETLCGQAYGARQYRKLGTYIYCSIISLILVCFPNSVLWIFTNKLLILTGQEPAIACVAQKYSTCLIPNLFWYAVLQALIWYLQTQSLILPMLVSSSVTLCFYVPLCWALVFKLKLGCVGAALPIGLAYWLNVFLLGFYMKDSSLCEKTRAAFSKDVFLSIKEFFKFAVPSAVPDIFLHAKHFNSLEWQSYELIILLSGLIPNPELETLVLSICFPITYLHYFIPYGFRATARICVGTLHYPRHNIVPAVAETCPDTSGVDTLMSWDANDVGVDMYSRCGLHVGEENGQSFPTGYKRKWVAEFRSLWKGLLIGLATGSSVQAALLALRTIFTDWQKQASKARERIFEADSQPS
ncbi:hypothetical protein Patl1_07682 [Pistacia atlantica]|uniref:Uncharacterized protein n=1 Tax=Pistacia atlantica TaxID=434234 RepID=A0ACC1AGH3_9ROSI|nr:hypothetical protein Patl1_07682 [Pistacia atlantica]